jgi:hypothetical protein
MHGVSFGLALDMTLCADIRICVSTTRFAVKEVDIGLAADIGTLTRLPKANIPMSFIKDVALTARVFTAQEALTVGIVSAVYDTKAEALAKAVEKATLIASKSPVAIMGTKEVLNYSRDHSVADGKFECLYCTASCILTVFVSRFEICLGVECSILQHCRCDRLVDGGHQEDEAYLCKALSELDEQGDVMKEKRRVIAD